MSLAASSEDQPMGIDQWHFKPPVVSLLSWQFTRTGENTDRFNSLSAPSLKHNGIDCHNPCTHVNHILTLIAVSNDYKVRTGALVDNCIGHLAVDWIYLLSGVWSGTANAAFRGCNFSWPIRCHHKAALQLDKSYVIVELRLMKLSWCPKRNLFD